MVVVRFDCNKLVLLACGISVQSVAKYRKTFLLTVVYAPGCNVLLSFVSDHYVYGKTVASAIPCGAQF